MPQDGLAETYRGSVAAWECDAFGHLNIAFYGERFADAASGLLERTRPGTRWHLQALDIRYRRELRASEGIAIRSGILGVDGTAVRVAHRAVNAAGECTTLAEHVLASEGTEAAAPVAAPFAWERFASLDLPAGEGPLAAGRSRVHARDAEEGSLTLLGYLHRFSDACLSVIEAIGMSDAYRRGADRGFATVETRLLLTRERVPPGTGVVVTSGVLAMGGSSLRILHRLRDTSDGRLLARFYQAGVNFDLAARCAAPWPQEFRAKAEALSIADA